ncbi:MAG: phosphopentomutase [Bacteroidota bacterium]
MSTTKKIVLIVLDGVGCGELPDARRYGDEGSNTLANTAQAVGGLRLPRLEAFGLGNIVPIQGVQPAGVPSASFGKIAEKSKGKDSTTGHWELAGLVVEKEFPTYPKGFPASLIDRFLSVTGCAGYLGNRTASGTAIIQELGDEHVHTGYPIVYTSADSVFQIAAHEDVIPIDRLYQICTLTRTHVCNGEHAVGRVIARPFVGTSGAYHRTTNRRDFSLAPPAPTVLDLLADDGVETVSVGKVDDLFAGRGLTSTNHTTSNEEGVKALIREGKKQRNALLFANLVDFDTLYGHRNDPKGFAAALEKFDEALPAIAETIGEHDLLMITADHGNDPVTPSTDHSREYVPLLAYSASRKKGNALGTRASFADVGKTIAEFFGLRTSLAGESFLPQVMAA